MQGIRSPATNTNFAFIPLTTFRQNLRAVRKHEKGKAGAVGG